MFWQNKKTAKQKRIFLDYASTTPIASEVTEKMREAVKELWAIPSALYAEAILAKEKLTEARQTIATVLGCQKQDVIFTSGGTESNNLALLGVFEASTKADFVPHIITTAIEHSSVLEVCKEIERRGGEVTYLPVSEDGIVSAKDVRNVIKENTVLVSVMYFHTDACQAVLYEELSMQKLGVDMMTLDGIKMYGPRGAGVLCAKSGVEINPVLFGGGQESGRRSGTENVVGAVGLAHALETAHGMREGESVRLSEIRDYAIETILKTFPNATLNGSRENRLPNNINICFPGLDAEFAVISLDVAGISASYSSSCRTLAEDSSSYVVSALGKDGCEKSSLRFTLGRESTKSDIDALIIALKKIVIQ